MTDNRVYKNAVLDDLELQAGLKSINPKFGDFVIRVAGEAWDLPLIDQKTKALMAIAVDVVNQNHKGPGNPFAAHLDMALKQGATHQEIEELLLFMCVYAGFNKVAGCFSTLNEIFKQSSVELRNAAMISAIKKADYAIRDQNGTAVFYVLLWKRKSITLDLFDDYWRNVHGPVCARLPGQHQYWQFHLADNQGDLWPTIEGIEYDLAPEDQFNGIAQLTFESEVDRQTWFKSADILMDDERNIFSKAIGYSAIAGNSKTYLDGIPTGDPNGKQGILKFHVMLQKADAISLDEFHKYMTDSFAAAVIQSDSVLKFRLHLFEEVDNSRPDAAGVSHYEPPQKQYQAAFEIAFSNPLQMETFFASKEYAKAVKDQANYVKQLLPFAERTAYTFVYNGKMTLAGQRSSKVANLIEKVGATNQLKSDIVSLFTKVQEEDKMKNQNMINGRFLAVSDDNLPNLIPKQEGATSQRIHAISSIPVNASWSTVWNMMLDKVENPGRYNPVASDYKILERYTNGVLRQMKAANMIVKEIITWDEKTGEIRHKLVDNPFFIGEAVNAVVQPQSNNSNDSLILTYTLDWEPYNLEGRKVAQEIQEKIAQAVEQAVLKGVTVAEQQEVQKKSPHAVSDSKVNGGKPMLETLPGTTSDMVKQLFARGEAFDSEGFISFFIDTPVYQFGNLEPCLNKAAIKKSVDSFFSQVSALYHEIKMMWEVGDVVFVEMDVIYWRQDGSVVTLPCCDIFRVEGDKFSELRIFMDANPVGDPTIPVPATSSVLTVSQEKRIITHNVMKKFFAEHTEGKKRVESGFAPKWSIAGPKWSIEPKSAIVTNSKG